MKRLLLIVFVLPLLLGQSECGQDDSLVFLLPGDVELVMRPIHAGTFMMGSTNGEMDEEPVHEITISQDFHLGTFEVTKAQWEAVMETTPWSGSSSVVNDPDSPAVRVGWNRAQEFITKLNTFTGETFRLPTEAEWEYACRAGSTTEYYFGDSSATLSDHAWWKENAFDVGEDYAHVVGQFRPNAFGLYDMYGNVLEWCEDWYDSGYYSVSPDADPTGPKSGTSRVTRGHSWESIASECRSAKRHRNLPMSTTTSIGFRLAR